MGRDQSKLVDNRGIHSVHRCSEILLQNTTIHFYTNTTSVTSFQSPKVSVPLREA